MTNAALEVEVPIALKRAALYLRVSTSAQADKDEDPEGYSLPAQREACLRKAESLGAVVIEEYVDRGESAKTARRPQLQALLERVKRERDIDYLIVHKVDRLARSRYDDVTIVASLKAAGVQLVSVSENIDETPSGKLLHGFMATIAEFYSANLAAEALKGMTQKAKVGGTPGKAPTGYLNVRDHIDGREVRTVIVDPVRGPFIQMAFELYATGDWTLRQLHRELSDRGLRSAASPKTADKPLSLSKFAKILSNRYYLGVVRFKGVEYPGRHEALVTPELFERVQVVLDTHTNADERNRRHPHYLKGTLYCARCRSRLSIQPATGKSGGQYVYFFCLGRQRGTKCGQPFIQVEQIEDAVAAYWSTHRLDAKTLKALRHELTQTLATQHTAIKSEAQRQAARIPRLKDEQLKLLQAHYAGAIPLDLLAQEQARISREMDKATAALDGNSTEFRRIETLFGQLLDLVEHGSELYQSSPDNIRRLLNQAIFSKLFVDCGEVVEAELSELVEAVAGAAFDRQRKERQVEHHPYRRDTKNPSLVSSGWGSSSDPLVGEGGLELRSEAC